MNNRTLTVFFAAAVAASACVTLAAPAWAQNKPPIKIGVPFPQSGPLGILYESEKQAVDFAVAQVNEKGGILGRKVEVRYVDTEAKPDVARKQIEKLALDGYNLIFGTVTSGESFAVAPNLKRWNAVMVAPYSKSSKLNGDSCQSRWFRSDPNDPMEIATLKVWLESRPEKKWASIALDYAFGHDATEGILATSKSIGKEISPNLFVPLGTNDYGPYIQQLKNAAPEGLLVILAGQDSINFARQAKQFGLLDSVKVIGGISFTADATLQAVGKDMVGIYGNIEFSPAMDTPEAKAFVEGWKKMYGTEPLDQSGEGFNGITILLQAIEKAGTDDPEAVAKALHGGTFSTLFGKAVMRTGDHQLMVPTYFGEVRELNGAVRNVPTLAVPAEKALPIPDPACKMGAM
jgi:branched-chain amino acid transport system substrate-binding protein